MMESFALLSVAAFVFLCCGGCTTVVLDRDECVAGRLLFGGFALACGILGAALAACGLGVW